MKRKMRLILGIAILIAFITTTLGLTTIAVKSIKLNTASVKILFGKTYRLKVTLTPANATNKKVTFSSADKSIATVSTTGYIKGIKPGKTVITVISASNKKAAAKCNVTVLEPLSFPLKNTITLKVLCTYNPSAPQPNNEMEGLKKLTKITGIKIDWETIPNEGYAEAVTTRLAAATGLPDILVPGSQAMSYRLINDKLIIPINNYINKYCPELVQFLDANPLDKALYIYPDGNIYSIGIYNQPTHMTYGYLINQVQLKKLGLKTPETINDLYNALVKFKNAGMKQPWAPIWGEEMVLASAWGVHIHPGLGASSFWAYDGKVAYEWMNPNLKEFYAWANKCYKEGLMDKEYATQSWDTITAKIAKGDVGFMDIPVGCAWSFNVTASKTEKNTFLPMPPVKGPNGDRFILNNAPGSSGAYHVTKYCKNPDVATKFLSWCLFSQESFDLMYWGTEGKTYLIKDGKKIRPEGYNQDMLGKEYPQNALPYNQFFPQISEVWPEGGTDAVAQADLLVQPFFIDSYPKNLLTEEEISIWSKKMADITTYVNENKQKFISGEKPLAEWDSYISGLKALGIDEVLKIEQARYNRFLAATKK